MKILPIILLLFTFESFAITLEGDVEEGVLAEIIEQLELGVEIYKSGFLVQTAKPVSKDNINKIINKNGYFRVIYNKHMNGYSYFEARYFCSEKGCRIKFTEHGFSLSH